MARSADKMTRKQLLKTPDEFISTSARVLGWAAAHRRELNIGAMLVVLLLLLGTAVRWYTQHTQRQAERALESAQARYASLQGSSGVEKAYNELRPEFETLLKRSGAGPAARTARLLLAEMALRAKDTATAIAQYEALLSQWGDSAFYASLIRRSLANAYRQQGDTAGAVAQFEALIALTDGSGKDEALFNLGILYAQLNQADKSRAAYKRLLDEYPDSVYAAPARDKTVG